MSPIIYLSLYMYVSIYVYQSQNLTVTSARNWRVCRAGADREEGRVIQCKTGHGIGTDQKRQSKSRSERGQKAGQGMMGIVKYK